MGNLLYTIAVVLIIIWLLGFLGVLGTGIGSSNLIHILLVIAVIAIILRLIQGRGVWQEKFDAVFLYLNLPDGLGFDLLPLIKEDQHKVKVIMISAFDGQAERRRATEQGADYFIGKPFTRRSVEMALQTIQVWVTLFIQPA